MIDSPCIRRCTLDTQRTCLGCGRSIDEIIGWTSMTPAERSAVMADLPRRLARGAAGAADRPAPSPPS